MTVNLYQKYRQLQNKLDIIENRLTENLRERYTLHTHVLSPSYKFPTRQKLFCVR